MRPLEQQLQSGEWLIFAGRAHWIRFVLPILPLAAGVALWVADHHGAAIALLICGAAIALPLVLESVWSRFIVTNQRVILRRGLLSPRLESFPLAEIASIDLHQDGIGRWIKAGRITLATTDGRERSLPWIGRARTFRRLALEQQRSAQEGAAGRLPATS